MMKNVWYSCCLVIFCSFLLAVLSACQKEGISNPLLSYSGSALGTTYSIKIPAPLPDHLTYQELQNDISVLLKDIDDSMSTFNPESDLYQFNHRDQTEWFPVADPFYQVVTNALRIGHLTDGAFDISIGGIVDLWGFGPSLKLDTIPTEDQIRQLLDHVDYRKIKTRPDPPAIRKTDRRMVIDLSAIAKGYAVDRVAAFFDKQGILSYLIEIGGEIRTKGTKESQKPWRIAIEKPVINQRSIYKIVELMNLSMATSGDYRNYFVKDGRRYSHMINPYTGKPVETDIASVSVVHRSCMIADAFATAFMVLGPQKGMRIAEKENLAVLFIERKDGILTEISSSSFKQLIN